ncbi:MAG: hypothetical protein JNL67_20255 [Planctomycetaceae bacterium]|nr:hypothetical protein [Planctomycetaceae bacterium]
MCFVVRIGSIPSLNLAWNRWSIGLLLFCAIGCEDQTIREIRVPRDKSGLDAPQFQPGNRQLERLLIAMIARPESTYFLRIQSPTIQAVDIVRPEFDQLVQSLTYENGGIQWKLPAGWSEREGGAEFRMATLTSPSGIEVLVSQLSAGQDVLANVNRWQGQLGLPVLTEQELKIERVKVGDQEVIIYDARRAAQGGASGAPLGDTAPSTSSVPPGAGPARESTEIPFRFPELPAEWTKLPPTMALARWERQGDSGRMKLEVFKFPSDASFMEMVSIWGERVNANPPTEDAFTAAIKTSTIAGQSADFVSWPVPSTDPASVAPEKSLQIARVKIAEHAWYIKLEGDHKAVTEFATTFQEFLANITPAE